MSYLVFSRSQHTIELYTAQGQNLKTWEAYNNVDSHSKGTWPNGRYKFAHYNAHSGQGVNDSYGSHGIFVFDVPGRSGMGVHAGRLHAKHGPGGPKHATMGCIRTTEEAMVALLKLHHSGDKMDHIVVGLGRLGDYPVKSSKLAYA